MNCQEVMELMQRQLDDDLSDAELEVLMNHTGQCPDCAAMFERMKRLSAELTALPKVTPSYSLVDAIMPELERLDRLAASAAPGAEASSAASAPRRMARKRRWTTWSAIGSVVAAGVVAGLFIMNDPAAINDNDASNLSYSAANLPQQSEGMTADVLRKTESASGQAEIELKAHEMGSAQGFGAAGGNNPDAGGDVSVRGTENSTIEKGIVRDPVEVTDQYGTPDSGETEVQKEDQPDMGIAVANAFPSPDGQYVALLDQHAITIVSADDQKTVMQTSRKNGQHTAIAWSEDGSQLTYEVQLDRGAAEKYVILTSNWQEKKAAH